jgi:hypothetical protein
MISDRADPRTPRQSAEAIIKRGRTLGDPEMIQRGRDLLRYAEEQEAKRPSETRRPSQIYEPSRLDPGGSFIVGASVAGQIMGLVLVVFYVLSLFFGWVVTLAGMVAFALLLVAGYGAYCAIKRARQ